MGGRDGNKSVDEDGLAVVGLRTARAPESVRSPPPRKARIPMTRTMYAHQVATAAAGARPCDGFVSIAEKPWLAGTTQATNLPARPRELRST
jgi:hypothetical protein